MTESNHQVPGSSADPLVNPLRRRSIAVFDDYADAERAVDRLSDLGFQVARMAIVGHDLTFVEQVTGRATYATAALRGAASGALPGALIGWLFGLFSLINPLVASLLLALYGLIFGAVVGAVLCLIMHAAQRGRHDFDAVTLMVPNRFEVVVDAEVADEAARLLAESPVQPTRRSVRGPQVG
ncbi:MAG: general stress protein [Pseudonocardiaceae bacterium]